MSGPGCTRIDAVLANRAGAAAVKKVKLEWDLTCSDHVPIGVQLDTGIFTTVIKEPLRPKPIDTARAAKLTDDEIKEACDKVMVKYGEQLERALLERNVNKSHDIWCDMATDYLILISQKDPPKDAAGTPARGRPPAFRERRLVPTAMGQVYGIDSYKLADSDATVARCTHLVFLMKT